MRQLTVLSRIAAAAVVATSLALAGPAASQELKIAVAADVTSIDPHFFNLFPNNNIAEHIFDKLVQMDPDSRMIPGVATSWKALDDKTWEFKLRNVHYTPRTDEYTLAFLFKPSDKVAAK